MTGTGRIRWENDGQSGNYVGYVGTLPESAFRIYSPDTAHENWLLSVRVAAGRKFFYGDGPEPLEVEAEQWLEQFVASLGAIFPEDAYEFPCCEHDLETAYAPGAYVRYQNPDAGWPGDQDKARELLTLGRIYGIAWSDIGQSKTSLGLVGIDGTFNSVLFEPVDDQSPAPRTAEKETRQ